MAITTVERGANVAEGLDLLAATAEDLNAAMAGSSGEDSGSPPRMGID